MNIKLYPVSITLSTILFASCLGDGGSTIELLSQPSVVQLQPTEMIYFNNGAIVPTNFSSLNADDGDCFLLDFTIDYNDSANSDSDETGIYTATLRGTAEPVDRWTTYNELTDTIAPLPGERTIASLEKRYTVIRDHLFLYANQTVKDSIRVYHGYNMSFSPTQIPQTVELDPTNNPEVKTSVYELYLRAYFDQEGEKTGRGTYMDPEAFNINSFVEKFSPAELAKDSTHLYFKVVYAKSFNTDTTSINWAESDILKVAIK